MVLMWGKYVHQKESKHFNAEHTANNFSAIITKHDAPDQKIRCRKKISIHTKGKIYEDTSPLYNIHTYIV